jgi:osmotically-inducible protein OsmY
MRWLLALSISLLLVALPGPLTADEPDDDAIRDALMIKLAGDRDVRGTQIEVAVEDGVVTLEGPVADERARKRAEKLAKKQKGVEKVINKLEIAHTALGEP